MIVIVGCGTLGSRVAPLLEGHRLVLVDHDVVEERNVGVQRYMLSDIGKKKATALAKHVRGVSTFTVFLDRTNLELLAEADVVVDCTDNLATRELLGAYCYKEGIALVHGAAAREKGVVSLFTGKPCLASLYAGKVSVDTCRSTDIDLTVAARVAQEQARLAKRALDGGTHDGVHLLTPDSKHTVQLSEASNQQCTRELPKKKFYITYCTEAGCMAAKPLCQTTNTPRSGIQEGIQYSLLANGELRFHTQAEVDDLHRIAEVILIQES